MAVVLFTLPLLGDITLGSALGVVGTIASFLFSKTPSRPLPKAMTSAWGETWPLVYNTFRVPGKVIQAGNAVENDSKGKKGGPTFSLTFAIGVCEGVRQIGRIWADQQVIYDPRPIVVIPVWQPDTLYGAGDYVYADPSQPRWIFTATVNGESGPSAPAWNYESDQATRDGDIVWLATKYAPRNKIGKQYNFFFSIYNGTEDQLPDSSLEEFVGTGNQPAYRGLVYCAFYQFDLGRYGNRIPNFEFEILGEGTSEFVQGEELYGTAFSSIDPLSPPFLSDSANNLYNIADNAYEYANIKTLATTAMLSNTDLNTIAQDTFGCPPSYLPLGGWSEPSPIGANYFMQLGLCEPGGGSVLYHTVLLFQINPDGSFTALGCKSFEVPLEPFLYQIHAATIRPDTEEVMFAFSDFSSLGIHLEVLGPLSGMTGSWFPFSNVNRVQTPTGPGLETLGGDYAAVPGPYGGFCMSFVGADFYVTLNKAHMDWIASHMPGDTFYNDYYASLQSLWSTGVVIQVTSASDGDGTLNAILVGPGHFFGWPFADEGLNSTGAPGNTTDISQPLDDWGIPVQQQELNGTVDAVWFARGYSDHPNEIGVKQFVDGALTEEVDQSPFAGSFGEPGGPNQIMVNQGPDGSIYGRFNASSAYYFKLGYFGNTELTLADICADISKRVGLSPSQYDYSGLASVVPLGTAFLQRDTARSYIESLQPAFFFDLVDIGAKIVGTLRSNDAVVQTIPESDLSATQAEAAEKGTIVDKISSIRNDDIEIPQDLSINYYDSQHDYQQGSQQARREAITQYSSGKNTVSVPVVMTPYDANNAAQRSLFLLWVERIQRKFILPPEYLARTAADVVTVVRNNKNHVVRITMVTLKTNWTIEISAVSEDLGTYAITGPVPITSTASGSFSSGTIDPASTPVLAVVDTATLRPDDLTLPGTYVAAANSEPGTTYDTVYAQDSPDDSVFTTEATLPVTSTIGTVASPLGNWPHYGILDIANSLTVSLLAGMLGSADKWALSANLATNLAWLSNGEVIQFATATLLSGDGTEGNPYIFKLTGLRRGRCGTEQLISTHGPNETFVLLNQTTMQNVTYSASEIGATRYWQALNDAPINPASPVQTLTMATRRLLPFAPGFIRGSRDGGKNLTITGLRRARWHGQPLWTPAETDTPQTVQVDVLDGSTVVRTLTSALSGNGSGITDPVGFSAYYAEADQVIDFGSAQASISLKAYSLNATIGRGYGGARAV